MTKLTPRFYRYLTRAKITSPPTIIKDQIDKETDKHFDWLVQFLAPKEYISGKQFSEITTAFAKEFMCNDETKNNSENEK